MFGHGTRPARATAGRVSTASAATTTSGTCCCRTSSSTSRLRTRSSGTLERRSGKATIKATSLNRAAVTTRERRARCTGRTEAFDGMIFRADLQSEGPFCRCDPQGCTPCLKRLAPKAPNDPSPLLTEKRSHTMAVDPPAREITSRHRIDRRSLLPLAARRDAVAACATRLDLRMD